MTACSGSPARDATTANDPFALVRTADQLARDGDWPEATREYLLALDEGRQRDSAFAAARDEVVFKLALLGKQYSPAREALAARTHVFAKKIHLAITDGSEINGMDLLLFVQLGRSSGNEAEVRSTNAAAKAALPANSSLRIRLASALEQSLVADRRYADAIAESDPGAVAYYLNLFKDSRDDPMMKGAVTVTIRSEGRSHYEALLGVGRDEEANALASELLRYSPTKQTYEALLEGARRSGAEGAAAKLKQEAQTRGIALSSETPEPR